MTTEETTTEQKPASDGRLVAFTVRNGLGDESCFSLRVKPGRTAKSYTGFAILRATQVIPQEKPYTVTYEPER